MTRNHPLVVIQRVVQQPPRTSTPRLRSSRSFFIVAGQDQRGHTVRPGTGQTWVGAKLPGDRVAEMKTAFAATGTDIKFDVQLANGNHVVDTVVDMSIHGAQQELDVLTAGLKGNFSLLLVTGAARPGPKPTEHYAIDLSTHAATPQPVRLATAAGDGVGIVLAGETSQINAMHSWISGTFTCGPAEVSRGADSLTFVAHVDKATP
jgi:hypothetical protein